MPPSLPASHANASAFARLRGRRPFQVLLLTLGAFFAFSILNRSQNKNTSNDSSFTSTRGCDGLRTNACGDDRDPFQKQQQQQRVRAEDSKDMLSGSSSLSLRPSTASTSAVGLAGETPPGSAASAAASSSPLVDPKKVRVRVFPKELPPFHGSAGVDDLLTGREIMALLAQGRSYADEATAEGNTTAVRTEALATGTGGGSDRCVGINMSALAKGMACGAPLGTPCFDRSRCRAATGTNGLGPSIYVYDATCSLANSSQLPPSDESLQLSHTWREVVREAGLLAERYEDACLFVHVNKLLDRPPCATERPLWNGGMNHVMVDLTDRTRDMRPAVANSTAMDASSNMRSCYYRSGYDFAVPLRHKQDLSNLTHIDPWKREYFLTVKASLYLSGNGYDERINLVPVHDESKGVVIAMNCFEMHGEHLLPENLAFCDALNSTAWRHDFTDLMNTTFGLVPAGRSPATYRLAEVMSAGAIPVFVTRDYIRPFPERVDWPSFSFTFTPEEIGPAMMNALRSVTPEELWHMQRKSVDAFHDIFGEKPGYSRIARTVIDELVKRVGYH